MKKKVVSLLICSALMMVEGVTTYAQTLSVSPADGNKTTIEAPSENKEQKKEKETSQAPEEKSTEDKCKKTSKESSKDDVEDTSRNSCKKKEKKKEDKKKRILMILLSTISTFIGGLLMLNI